MNARALQHDLHAGDLRRALADILRETCLLEIRALKPGNVGLHGDGHGMQAEDFTKSAHAIAMPMTTPHLGVGDRILWGTLATQHVVNCNTNLGIILLCAPLIQAAWNEVNTNSEKFVLCAGLQNVLAQLDQEDTEQTYKAIRLANPGGLGKAEKFDVKDTPAITLLQAMQEAAGWDSIARQYATGFADIFSIGVPVFEAALAHGLTEEWATAACYLQWLTNVPDTHVARKYGTEVAEDLRSEARQYTNDFIHAADPQSIGASLLQWDVDLKQRGINPGTSADLTVASVLASRLQTLLRQHRQYKPVTQCGENISHA